MCMKEQQDRHFTATTFIIKDDKVLLIRHKKLGFWLPPGGHIESNELPDEAAIREVKEEVGLNITLVGERDGGGDSQRVKSLVKPTHILLEEIAPGHFHIDLVYLARVNGSAEISGEKLEARWFSREDLEKERLLPNIRHFGKLAIEKVSG